MKKHLIVIGTVVLLLAVGLSGCQDEVVSINPDSIKIHNKYIRTVKYEY